MSPIAIFFASGESLYPGVAVLSFSIAMASFRLPNLIGWMGRFSLWIGVAFVIMACPPVSWIVGALFGVACLAWIITGYRRPSSSRRQGILRGALAVSLVVILLMVAATDFLHRRMPTIQGEHADHLVVLGDSISAGIGTRVRPWPDLMKEMTGFEIVNLSVPGATVLSGLAMANRLSVQDHLILIELGGNDLISGESSAVFQRSLNELLTKVVLPGRTVVMFELPLLPHMIRFGQVQRTLARKYGVWLIPKRCLTKVISGKDATSDGLHLTDAGARRMASLVTEVLSPVLQTRPLAPSATKPFGSLVR